MGMFVLTLQKFRFLSSIFTKIWPGQNTNSKGVSFCQNFNNIWQNTILIFCCTTSVGMLFMDLFPFVFARKVLGDMARPRVVLHTDRWTDIHGGKNNICLPHGETYNYYFTQYRCSVHSRWNYVYLERFTGCVLCKNIID